jgi:peptide/nickel transport system ATP-binding protein
MLQTRDLKVALDAEAGLVKAIDGLTMAISRGETFALVGESGCGKSMTALALMRLLPENGHVTDGDVRLDGDDLLALSEAGMRRIRGGRIGMIFQEPSTSLNPVVKVGAQIVEAIETHTALRGPAARAKAVEWLRRVGIPEPERRADDYPFRMSGGQKQRVMIAMTLATEPDFLVADEPTTALDVTIQAQVLDLLKDLQREQGLGLLLITHDLAVVAGMAHRVALMYAGQIIEVAPAAEFFAVRCLLAVPGAMGAPSEVEGIGRGDGVSTRIDIVRAPDKVVAAPAGTLLDVQGLRVRFPIRSALLRRGKAFFDAVDGVSFSVAERETLALVGESGCGKTTTGKAVVQLLRTAATFEGKALLQGRNLFELSGPALTQARRDRQIIVQDPFASLDPRMRVVDILDEGMVALLPEIGVAARRERIDRLIDQVGLRRDALARYPHEFSGGQRQRIAIARALAVQPKLIVCDEPTSALDVSVQAQILNLLHDLQQALGVSYLFITHNIGVVEYIADRVAVMRAGRIVEQGDCDDVLENPRDPYTRNLIDAVPRLQLPVQITPH